MVSVLAVIAVTVIVVLALPKGDRDANGGVVDVATGAAEQTPEQEVAPPASATPAPRPTEETPADTPTPEVVVKVITASYTPTSPPAPTSTPTAAPAGRLGENLIAYGVQSGEVWSIWLIAPDGSGRRSLPGAPYNHLVPDFSPDGERIAFRSRVGDTWQIFTVRLDGGTCARSPPGRAITMRPTIRLTEGA